MNEARTSEKRLCPNCKTVPLKPYAEVDIGVGVMQGGPWGCPACHWVEELGGCPFCGNPQCDGTCTEDVDPFEAAGESRFGLPGGGKSL